MNPSLISPNEQNGNDLRDAENQSGTECGTVDAKTDVIDPDLQAIIDAWPTLSSAVKAGVLAMVTAAGED